MSDSLQKSFGLVIAYVLPGFIVVAGLSWHWPALATWLRAEPTLAPTMGEFLYVVMASLGAGLIASAIRWALIDALHHATGLPAPRIDFSRLPERLEAFNLAVEHYYRYYQFYANSLVALAICAGCYRTAGQFLNWRLVVAGLLLALILLAASRDSLRRYYTRVSLLLGTFRPATASEVIGWLVLGEPALEVGDEILDRNPEGSAERT
jgi:hypothetical protein